MAHIINILPIPTPTVDWKNHYDKIVDGLQRFSIVYPTETKTGFICPNCEGRFVEPSEITREPSTGEDILGHKQKGDPKKFCSADTKIQDYEKIGTATYAKWDTFIDYNSTLPHIKKGYKCVTCHVIFDTSAAYKHHVTMSFRHSRTPIPIFCEETDDICYRMSNETIIHTKDLNNVLDISLHEMYPKEITVDGSSYYEKEEASSLRTRRKTPINTEKCDINGKTRFESPDASKHRITARKMDIAHRKFRQLYLYHINHHNIESWGELGDTFSVNSSDKPRPSKIPYSITELMDIIKGPLGDSEVLLNVTTFASMLYKSVMSNKLTKEQAKKSFRRYIVLMGGSLPPGEWDLSALNPPYSVQMDGFLIRNKGNKRAIAMLRDYSFKKEMEFARGLYSKRCKKAELAGDYDPFLLELHEEFFLIYQENK